jgi:hypothetical protein
LGVTIYITIIAYVIAFLGLVMIGVVVWVLVYLQLGPMPISSRYYAMVIGMICAGLGLGGIAQGLRVSVAIATRLQNMRRSRWK